MNNGELADTWGLPALKFIKVSSPSNRVALLRLARGPVNAFHEPFWRELQRVFETLSTNPKVRCIVLSSDFEKVFTAGLDLTSAGNLTNDSGDAARIAYLMHDHIRDFQDAVSSIEKCHKPVIAAITGLCLGLGVDIACACDMRIASTNASFAIMEVLVGLAADIGSLQRFPKIVKSDSLARELAMTGRRFTSEEALEIGFVSRIVPGGKEEVEAAGIRLATDIAAKSPVAVIGTKKLMNYSRDHSVQEGLEFTAAWNMAMLQTKDLKQGLKNIGNKNGQAIYDDMPPAAAKL